MAILSDRWIRSEARRTGMIEPFVERQQAGGCISYGLSSYGYDASGLEPRTDLCKAEIWS